MIDQWTSDRTGWARFSDDRKMRYRLARALTPKGARAMAAGVPFATLDGELDPLRRIVFLLVNPSTADAFRPDPTASKCIQFAQRWGGDIIEVVNLFALRSTDPAGLDEPLDIGDGPDNDAAILEACRGAARVIAGWGNNGHRAARDELVRSRLAQWGIDLEILGKTKDGFPLHPLARGKSFIPLDREPVAWA